MNYEKNSYFFRKISSKMLWKSKDINMFKKKFLSVLSLILISVSLFGKTLLPAERFSHYGEENPLENTAVERIYKVKPDISFQELIATGAEYTVVLYDGNTKVMEFPNVVYHWFGMTGWNGLITEKDLSVVTSDGIHYVVKAELFSSIVVEEENEIDGIVINVQRKFWVLLSVFLGAVIFIALLVFAIFKKKKIILTKKDIEWIRESEKEIISREIHDSIVQDIRAIRLDVDRINSDDVQFKNQVVEKISETLIKMRDICYGLAPAEISSCFESDSIKLVSIIDTLCQQFMARTKVHCNLQAEEHIDEIAFNREISINVIRVFQEILKNIEKHSYAPNVTVLIRKNSENKKEFFQIIVIDDGVGCDLKKMNSSKNHFGVKNMRERMKSINGNIDFYSYPKHGMKVVLDIEVKQE